MADKAKNRGIWLRWPSGSSSGKRRAHRSQIKHGMVDLQPQWPHPGLQIDHPMLDLAPMGPALPRRRARGPSEPDSLILGFICHPSLVLAPMAVSLPCREAEGPLEPESVIFREVLAFIWAHRGCILAFPHAPLRPLSL
eukprot:3417233-Karenia_brevis.AAC.1